jgi:hypothetical protein
MHYRVVELVERKAPHLLYLLQRRDSTHLKAPNSAAVARCPRDPFQLAGSVCRLFVGVKESSLARF